jgi:hemerythrin-like domain-containing protein
VEAEDGGDDGTRRKKGGRKEMKATKQLEDEHEGIRLSLRALERICAKIESGEEPNLDHLQGLIEFYRVFVDRCHHGKEEDVLFPAMARAGIPREGGPIGVMLSEHELGRAAVKGMADALDAYRAGDRRAISAFLRNAKDYVLLLEQHILKENGVLYPMAESLIASEDEALCRAFDAIETDRVGEGRHEEFHRFLHALRDAYLK